MATKKPHQLRAKSKWLFTTPLSDSSRRELKRLARMPDSEIDFSDAREAVVQASALQVGRFYRPIKRLISLRIDGDVLAWFRDRGPKYQTCINEVLRYEAAPHADRR